MLEQFRGDDPATQQRITERYELLRVLRGAGAPPARAAAPPTEADTHTTVQNSNVTIVGDLVQAERIYDRSAHAEVAGSTAIVYNINTIQQLERRWTRPSAEPLRKDMIPREAKVAEVARLLESRGEVAIVGSGRVAALAVQATAGVGKTTLGKLLVQQVQARYPDGVLWEELGSTVRRRDDAAIQGILSRWGSMAVVGPQDRREPLLFEPSAVRMLLSEHPGLLVVLDNVWSLDAIRPLRDALPEGAHLLVTTRSREVMQRLGGEIYALGLLDEDEALALAEFRLNWKPDTEADRQWLTELFKGVGWHALALDIALSRMALEGETPAEWMIVAGEIVQSVREGRRFDDLRLEDGEREDDVEFMLRFSYERMEPDAQQRFRMLGALAPESSFNTSMAAHLWQCDEDAARRQLNAFVNAALLNREGEGRWQQHGLLRGYALALLRRAGDYERAAARHAAVYDEAMRVANDSGRFYVMRPDYAQLQHAFGWAIDNDLDRAQNLIGNCAELQTAFFALGRDNLRWGEAGLVAAQQRGTPADVARAHGSLGNALGRVATLGAEDRGARLREALAAYEAALRFYTPEAAPLAYATTQNNRGNVFQGLATLGAEDRGARLREALAAYEAALRFRTPEAAPLDYAMTQSNLLNLYQAMADLPKENRRSRLADALRAGWIAFGLFGQLQHSYYQQHAARQLRGLRSACGADFEKLWQALDAGPMPEWLRQGDEEPDSLNQAFSEFLNAQSLEDVRRLLDEHPLLLSAELESSFTALLTQYVDDQGALAQIESRRALLQACRDQGIETVFAQMQQAMEQPQQVQQFQQALNKYLEQVQAAEADQQDADSWRAAVEAGEALLAPELAETPGVNWDALRANLASTYNTLGNALDGSDKEQALTAFERAVALQPAFAMWRRNRTGMLIDLGQLDEAEAETDRARALESDAARLAELDEALRRARDAG